MTPELIGAYAAGIVAIIGAIFNGIALIRHVSNTNAHDRTGTGN